MAVGSPSGEVFWGIIELNEARWVTGVGSVRRGVVWGRVARRGSKSAAGSQEAPLLWFGFDMKIDWPSESSVWVSRAWPVSDELGDMGRGEERG